MCLLRQNRFLLLAARITSSTPFKTMKTSLLGLMDVLGLSRRILARFLQTFNNKVYGVPTVLPQPGPYLCHVKEVDAVAEVLRPLWKTMPVDAEGFIEIRSLWYLAHQYLFSQASSSKFRVVQSSFWDVVDLSPRVPNFDEIRLCFVDDVGLVLRVSASIGFSSLSVPWTRGFLRFSQFFACCLIRHCGSGDGRAVFLFVSLGYRADEQFWRLINLAGSF